MRKSTNYKMNLFDEDEFYNEEQFNENTEKTDEVLKSLENPEYEESEKLEELQSGESVIKAFGKLAKAVADYISHKEDETIHFTTEEREKLKNIAVGATKVIVDTALSSTSTNTVQNSTIYAALAKKIETSKIVNNLTTTATDTVLSGPMGKQLQDNKVDKVSGKGLSANDYTTTEKNKLAGIATGANKTTVDSTLSASSTNPVQNKIVYENIKELLSIAVFLLKSSGNLTSVSVVNLNNAELGGSIYYACIPEDTAKANVGKTVLVFFSNGAIGKTKIGSTGYSINSGIEWLTSTTVPYVNKTDIQAGTNTLAVNSAGGAYTVAAGYGYGAVLELSKANSFSTKFYIV